MAHGTSTDQPPAPGHSLTTNPGCIIQIAQGLRARGAPIPALHIVEMLDRAYGDRGWGE